MARSSQNKSKKPRTFKQRQADRARMVVHSLPFIWQNGQRRFTYGVSRLPCGQSVADRTGRTRPSRTEPNEVTCTGCQRVLAMTAEQYNAHILAEAKKLQDVRAKQRARADEERAARQREQWNQVHKYEDDALVTLDAYLAGVEYEHMREVLGAALVKYRMEHPESRGERLWVMSEAKFFKNDAKAPDTKRNIVCRFCRRLLGRGDLGKDYTYSWFSYDLHESATESWAREYTDTVLSPAYPVVSVGRHTTLCALAYLSGTQCVEPVPEGFGLWEADEVDE